MIKIDKNISEIPVSLIPALVDLFRGQNRIPLPSRTTHSKRMDIIRSQVIIDKKEYNSRYKLSDIRASLISIYNNKCAYCEQKAEQLNIEHYRPQKNYYWLVYSWDNLILACPNCNQFKGTHFELIGVKIEFANTEANIRNINCLSSNYDRVEQPKMVNPEVTDPLGSIEFQRDGLIKSSHDRFSYTIEKCKLDRKYLNDERRNLLDILIRDIQSALLENLNPVDQEAEVSAIIRKFIRDSKDAELPFLAFRRFAISSGWLSQILKELN